MKGIGWALISVGLVILLVGLARHESSFVLKGTSHASIIIGGVGLVVLVLGTAVRALGGMVEE